MSEIVVRQSAPVCLGVDVPSSNLNPQLLPCCLLCCPLLQGPLTIGNPTNTKTPEVSGGAATTTGLKKKHNNANDATSLIASQIAVVDDHLGSDAYGRSSEVSEENSAAVPEQLEDLEGDGIPRSKKALRAEQQQLILSQAMKQLGFSAKLTPQEYRLWGTAFSLCDVRGQH
eukprot:INCI7688.11.p1 GENE.INCI7688.11~~INCI7688.11.p1  ORF type:complete len:172 (-),score=29.63 INCI7688.11:133-648(-)